MGISLIRRAMKFSPSVPRSQVGVGAARAPLYLISRTGVLDVIPA